MSNENIFFEAGILRGILNKTSIYELRELGFRIGVASSTTYGKDDLINKIIEKICAQKRPMNGKYYEATDFDCYELKQAFMNEVDVKSKAVDGILDGFAYGAMVRDQTLNSGKNEVFVPKWIMEKYDLRPGDYIKGKAINLSSNSMLGLIGVSEVNGREPLFGRKLFHEIKAYAPKNRLQLSLPEPLNAVDTYSPIAEGMRCLWKTDVRGNLLTKYLAEIPERLSKQGFKVYSLFLGEAPEIKNELTAKICENLFYTSFDEEISENFRIAQVVWDIAKREVEMGQKTVILVSRLESLDTVVEQSKLRTMFGSAKYCKTGSLTVIMCARRDYLLEDIADNIIVVNMNGKDVFYDYGNSYSALKNKE